jgi:hypothetical protein
MAPPYSPFERASVFEISRDPGCSEGVVADLGLNPGRRRTATNHGIRVFYRINRAFSHDPLSI